MRHQTDTERFERIALIHMNAAYNLARWLSRNDHDAEDIVQEAFLRAFKFFKGFHGDHARAWLLGIVRNTCYTWYEQNRKQRLNTPFEEESIDIASISFDTPDNDPQILLARSDNLRALNQALERLPLEFREAVILRDLEDFSYKEIAEITSVPIGTVMSRLARGRKLLSKYLAKTAQEVRDGV